MVTYSVSWLMTTGLLSSSGLASTGPVFKFGRRDNFRDFVQDTLAFVYGIGRVRDEFRGNLAITLRNDLLQQFCQRIGLPINKTREFAGLRGGGLIVGVRGLVGVGETLRISFCRSLCRNGHENFGQSLAQNQAASHFRSHHQRHVYQSQPSSEPLIKPHNILCCTPTSLQIVNPCTNTFTVLGPTPEGEVVAKWHGLAVSAAIFEAVYAALHRAFQLSTHALTHALFRDQHHKVKSLISGIVWQSLQQFSKPCSDPCPSNKCQKPNNARSYATNLS
jgi:hypothetical protein